MTGIALIISLLVSVASTVVCGFLSRKMDMSVLEAKMDNHIHTVNGLQLKGTTDDMRGFFLIKNPSIVSFPVANDGSYVLKNNKLYFVLNSERGINFELGRDADSDICLTSRSISRRHARAFISDGKWFLEDLNSHNGTLVNGNRINEPVEMREGDTIRLAGNELVFETNIVP